eukprot:TRINITY_DN12293_c0_g1_i1.p1 TRINITY_DN12293_c0_g1~~TRINITY_DN12293_c0_g1_i1.p1  ORF type:complete len:1329 (+),score=246.46 TRINITY_DN12293_c0_g1_i1:92-4078(+)
MDESKKYGSLTAVGRSLRISSALNPLVERLVALLPAALLRQHWRKALAFAMLARLLQKARAQRRLASRVQQPVAAAAAAPAAVKPNEAKPEPTWREILGREGTHVMAAYIELTVVAGASLVVTIIALYREHLQGQLYMAQADKRRWRRVLVLFPVATVIMAFTAQISDTCRDWVALRWRRAVVSRIHDLYFQRRMYYHLLNQPPSLAVPDPDMRICNDVKESCEAYANMMSGILQTIITLVLRSGSIAAQVGQIDRRWVLVPPLFSFWLLPSVLSLIDYAKLWPLWGQIQHHTAQLHSEQICMLQGERYEYNTLTWHLSQVLKSERGVAHACVQKDTIESFMFGELFPSGFQALGSFMSAAVISGAVQQSMRGEPSGLSVQQPRSDVLLHFSNYVRTWWGVVGIASTFSGLLQTMMALKETKASIHRVATLFTSMQNIREKLPATANAFQDVGPVISFKDVAVETPGGQKLLDHLSIEIVQGERLLICGHNGAGKSSIMRCLSGLWAIPSGIIARPGGSQLDNDEDGLSSELYYLPQKPCSVIGNLSDQITYPVRVPGGLPDKELRSWLRCVNLEYLADRAASSGSGRGSDAENTELQVSLGEHQALAIARLLYHRPRFAILDECTSAVSNQLERRLFDMARILGITCITITHRPALQELHTSQLRLTGRLEQDGRGWEHSLLKHREALPLVASRAASSEEAQVRLAEFIRSEGGGQASGAKPASAAAPEEQIIDEVLRRWPTSFARLRAVLALGLQARGSGFSFARRVLALLLGMRIHCDLLWQTWQAQMGAIAQGLSGNSAGVLSELVSYGIASCCISILDARIKCEGQLFTLDIAENASHELLKRIFNAAAFVGITRPGSQNYLENPMHRVSELKGHITEMGRVFVDSMFKCSHGLYTFRMLVRGLGPLAFASTPAYFAIYQFCLLFAPDFSFISRRQAQLETRFRMAHARLRSFAEPVAFSGGGLAERRNIEPHFEAAADFQQSSLRKVFVFHFIQRLFSHSNIPLYLQRLLASEFTRRNVPHSPTGVAPEVVVQGFLFERGIMYNEKMLQTLGGFMPIWRRWDGTNQRFLELSSALEKASSEVQEEDTAEEDEALPGGDIIINNLDLVATTDRCLARGLKFSLQEHAPLVVCGPNGSGKSVLGLALLRLWPGTGVQIELPSKAVTRSRPPLRLIMPAPQRVYLPQGSLGDQICYPGRYVPGSQHEAGMQSALEAAGIGYLLERHSTGWSQHCRWEDVLSGGEQQRMGFARVLFHRPQFALLDECTSMVAHDSEEGLYKTLAQEFKIVPITLSQRLCMQDLHHWELRLGLSDDATGWSLVDLRK